MKYWGYFIAKVLVAAVCCYGILLGIRALHEPQPFMRVYVSPFVHDLPYTFAMLGFWLFCCAVAWAIVWDQRYRCRTCLRRLRMPVLLGSWNYIIFSPPKTEYICPFGHGTLQVPELKISGKQPDDWREHGEDIWKELFTASTKR